MDGTICVLGIVHALVLPDHWLPFSVDESIDYDLCFVFESTFTPVAPLACADSYFDQLYDLSFL